jgi:hypothetical protein
MTSYSDDDNFMKPVENGNNRPWKLENDFQLFISQCALQSLLFHMASLRDRQTAIWLEEFTQPVIRERTKQKEGRDQVLGIMAKAMEEATEDIPAAEKDIKLLTYHGLAAMNTNIYPTWDSFFQKLLEMPEEVMTIHSGRAIIPDYEIEINPASLCNRLISVREQIAREFVMDLDSLAEISTNFITDFYEYQKNSDRVQQQEGQGYRTNLMFMDAISGQEDYVRPSPLRKGNFDLLTVLATQESIHRVLNDETVDRSSFRFLRNFYAQRIGSHFTGSNYFGRADNFLEELLTTPPCVVQMQDEECDLVDPVRVAELILKERESVTDEWIDLALNSPNLHTDIKRMQFQRLMGNYGQPPEQ